MNQRDETYTIAVLGSHSALDVCRGAKDEGFKTLVVTQKGRDKTYSKYFKSKKDLGCVDEVLELAKFGDLMSARVQNLLLKRNCIFIPHRSLEVYIGDYNKIEKFRVPVFGNKFLLRTEERTEKINQYDILKKAGIKFPVIFNRPDQIDRLVIVKVPEKERAFERAFFLASSTNQYNDISSKLLTSGRITQQALEEATIEEFILGVQVNFNFFYSALHNRLELLGTDTRRQTNLEGLLRLPAYNQQEIADKINLKFEEAGHIAVTTLESMLEDAFEIGHKFVKTTKKMFSPGIIGPFSLQSAITPGPPKKEIIVFDVSPRMPGSPGIFATPYSKYLWGESLSVGRRVAIEIKNAINSGQLKKILT